MLVPENGPVRGSVVLDYLKIVGPHSEYTGASVSGWHVLLDVEYVVCIVLRSTTVHRHTKNAESLPGKGLRMYTNAQKPNKP